MKPAKSPTSQVADSFNNPLSMLPYGFRFQVRKHLLKAIVLMVIFSLVSIPHRSQGQRQLHLLPGSQIMISGTSTLHPWTMQATGFKIEGNFVLEEGQLQDVTAFRFSLPVANLKSKDKQMDNRAYKALKANEHDQIIFKLTGAAVLPQQKIIKATGNLTIAGITNQVDIESGYVLHADQSITCKVSESIKMSDYKIQPPRFMMGQVKTGDEIMVNIVLKFKQ